jgi:Spy/CpxP family protein refolding chaperone
MKRFMKWMLAFALCAIYAQAALAQGGGGFGRGMGGGMGGGMMLLTLPEVQKELKLTPEQAAQVKAAQPDVQKAQQEIMQKAGGFQAMRDMSPEDRQKLMTDMGAVQSKAVAKILNATQQKRFHQLELQQSGPRAFSNPEVKTALNLTDEEVEKMAAIQTEQMQAMREAMQGINFQNMTDDDRATMQKKMAELQKTTMDKTLELLTPQQTKKWKEMTGEPFKFPAMGFGGPRGPRPGN